MTVTILLFGITKELVGKRQLSLDLPKDTTVALFKKILFDRYPELVSMDSVAIAVNGEYAPENLVIKSNDEIALIPPVSGG